MRCYGVVFKKPERWGTLHLPQSRISVTTVDNPNNNYYMGYILSTLLTDMVPASVRKLGSTSVVDKLPILPMDIIFACLPNNWQRFWLLQKHTGGAHFGKYLLSGRWTFRSPINAVDRVDGVDSGLGLAGRCPRARRVRDRFVFRHSHICQAPYKSFFCTL